MAEDTGNREVGNLESHFILKVWGDTNGKVMLLELPELIQMTFLYEHDNTFKNKQNLIFSPLFCVSARTELPAPIT